jgi:hypothetical protein
MAALVVSWGQSLLVSNCGEALCSPLILQVATNST